jgi:hypothetical protein
MFFSNPWSKGEEDQPPNTNHAASTFSEMQNKAHVDIAPGFQVFITCNDPQKLISALRSPCFCLNMESAKGNEDLTVFTGYPLFQKFYNGH